MSLPRRCHTPGNTVGRTGLGAGLVVASLLALAEPGQAQTKPDKQAIARGQTVYVRYCTACHGKEARGDGSLAKDLRIPVSDLTLLAANNGEKYPEERVTLVLAKGGTVRGHGSDDMPAWGPAFNRSAGIGDRTVDEAFRDLNHYLRSLQRSK
jgi:mono/diheme cytochrome c family protein